MLHVAFMGVESTGKSTLALRLADAMGAVVMPEYGREYAITIGTDFSPEALRHIAAVHAARLHHMRAPAPPLLIEDTDVITTAAWFRMLHGRRDPQISALPVLADLHLLFAPDTPWVDDGTRQFAGSQRLAFHRMLLDELAQRGVDAVSIGGNWQQRHDLARAAITRRLDKARAGTA